MKHIPNAIMQRHVRMKIIQHVAVWTKIIKTLVVVLAFFGGVTTTTLRCRYAILNFHKIKRLEVGAGVAESA